MGRRNKKSGYQLFRHQLIVCIIMFCVFALIAGWYLSSPSTALCTLMLICGIFVPLFPADTRPEMTDRDSEFFLGFIPSTLWILSIKDFLFANLISTGCAFVIGFILYRHRFSLQQWLCSHPSDQFVFTKSSWLMRIWSGSILIFGGTVGLITGGVNRIFSLVQLAVAAYFLLSAVIRRSYRLTFGDGFLFETHLLIKRQIPYDAVSHCAVGFFGEPKIIGKNHRTLVKIHLTMVGPTARLIRTFGKHTQR